jgi:heterodisulfide reductase subunit C
LGIKEAKMTIALSELDTKFKYDVANEPGGENTKVCFACGLCTASCPVADIDEKFNPRRIIRMVLLGMRKEVLSCVEKVKEIDVFCQKLRHEMVNAVVVSRSQGTEAEPSGLAKEALQRL